MTPLPDPSKAGFTKSGKGSATCRASSGDLASTKGAVGTPRCERISLARPLWRARLQRQRVRGVAGHAEELADGRDVRLAVGAVESFGDVEDEVGPEQREPRGEAGVGLEAVDLADRAERPLHRIDGGGLVPLGVEIWLMEVGAEGPTGRLVGRRGFGVRPGWTSRRRGFEIEGESDPNCQRLPLQKRPSARDEPRRVPTIDATKVRKSFWSHNSFWGRSGGEFLASRQSPVASRGSRDSEMTDCSATHDSQLVTDDW